MTSLKTQLSVLEETAIAQPSSPAFRLPQWSGSGGEFDGWTTVTFSQFRSDVEKAARYWISELSSLGATGRPIVGLWLKGTSYWDVVHIWGVARAGFIPQLFSLRLPNPAVVYELLARAGAKAFIFDPIFESMLGDRPVLALPAIELESLNVEHLPLPKLWTPSAAADITMIFHTSGSTSGSPKLVPCTAKWLDFNIDKLRSFACRSQATGKQEVLLSGSSVCHLAASLLVFAMNDRGGCIVLPTKMPYTSGELLRAVKDCEVTLVFKFASFIGSLIREARTNPDLLAALQAFDFVVHSGLPLAPPEAAWAVEQGINLIDVIASTEIGPMLQSTGGRGADARFLGPFPATAYEFMPVSEDSAESNGAAMGERLLELVVLSKSPDYPDALIGGDEDATYHTGDYYVEAAPGRYLNRGRGDDWIKMEMGLRCDTRSIEDNAIETCASDLISVASVVGSGRPQPTLFVEPKHNAQIDTQSAIATLKCKILDRITPFHERRYTHERIDETRFIVVLPMGSLPRTATKGNIQRTAVEQQFKEVMDQIYSG